MHRLTPRPRPRRTLGIRGTAATIVVAAAAVAGLLLSVDTRHLQPEYAGRDVAAVAPDLITAPPGWRLIATVKAAVNRYPTPGGRSDGTIPATWYGAPSALPVIGQEPGWIRVRIQNRPNESTAWVRTADVDVSATPYRIEINLTTKRLDLLNQGRVVLDAPAGIGAADDPTPTGAFFVAFFEQPPSPGYGPFVLVTSAHSNSISDWESSGDAVIGIHGPLGEDASIGTTGAAVSHGCIRMHDRDLEKLRQVPPGTPIDISR